MHLFIVKEKKIKKKERQLKLRLKHIGMFIEEILEGTYQSEFTTSTFQRKEEELLEYWQQYSHFAIRMIFTRRIESYFLNAYLPSILLVMGTWFGFLIDPASVPGRISLSLMLLLVSVNMG